VRSKCILPKGNSETGCPENGVVTYLQAVAASCLEVASNPQPQMLNTISGVLQLVARTLAELKPNKN